MDLSRRTRAIIVYPMNALAKSQVGELDRYFKGVVDPHLVTYKRYTGQESQDERQRVADNPPDVLLTNFMKLELLLTRQDELDQRVVGNCEGLDFLVLDDLHTYRGRQGARRRNASKAFARAACAGKASPLHRHLRNDDQ